MIELRGKAVADAHKAILQEKVAAVGNSVITMAVLLVGEDHGAHMYAIFMEKTAKNFGYGFVLKQLPETATQDEVVAALQELNSDASIHGILPLMPMPKHIDTEALIDMLDPKKDIDGLTTYNIGLVTAGKGGFAPCTAKACMAILNHYNISLYQYPTPLYDNQIFLLKDPDTTNIWTDCPQIDLIPRLTIMSQIYPTQKNPLNILLYNF
mgnify:CR=1 FL=1